jgi:hypothetical protein
MQGKTRSQKPSLVLGLEKSTRKRRSSRISEVVGEINVRLESCLNIQPIFSLLVEPLGVDTQKFPESVFLNTICT